MGMGLAGAANLHYTEGGYTMTLTLNPTLLTRVIAQARADVATQPDAKKWDAAISRAVKLLEENPWIERTDNGLLIAGTEGTWQANGSCQCPAYRAGMTHCKHRVLAKLVRRYDEAVAQQVVQQVARPSYTHALADIQELYA